MASAGAQVEHVKHVSTQLPYALTVAGISFVTYLAAGPVQDMVGNFALSAVLSLAFGVLLTVLCLILIRTIVKKKGAEQ